MSPVQPADVPADQLWLVQVDGVPHLGARAVPSGRAPWRVGRLDLSRVACVPDDEVTLARRLLPLDDLPPAPVATLPDEVPAGQPWTVHVDRSEAAIGLRQCPKSVKPWLVTTPDDGSYWAHDADIALVAPWVPQDQQPVEGRRKRQLRADLAEARRQLARALSEVGDLRRHRALAARRASDLDAERLAAIARIERLQEGQGVLRGERDAAQDELLKCDARLDVAIAERDEARTERDEARTERDHALAEAHRLQDELDEQQRDEQQRDEQQRGDVRSATWVTEPPDAGNPAHLRWAVDLLRDAAWWGVDVDQVDPILADITVQADRIETEQRVEAAEVEGVAREMWGGDETTIPHAWCDAPDHTRLRYRLAASRVLAAARRAREEAGQ